MGLGTRPPEREGDATTGEGGRRDHREREQEVSCREVRDEGRRVEETEVEGEGGRVFPPGGRVGSQERAQF